MSLVDSHCHLDFDQYKGDFDAMLARAKEAGVTNMVNIGVSLRRFDRVLKVAERYEHIFCTAGVHPHDAAAEPEVDTDALLVWANHPKVIGFGESGLDYFYNHSPKEDQKARFRSHIEAARLASLPLSVHTRDADEDTIALLQEGAKKGAFSGVIHCFTGGRRLAEVALELGFYISVSGVITFNKSEELRQIIADLPLDRLLVETDAPYLAPMPYRGKRNEPAYVVKTAERLAKIKNVSLEEVKAQTTENFFRLFSKASMGTP